MGMHMVDSCLCLHHSVSSVVVFDVADSLFAVADAASGIEGGWR